MTLTRFLFPFLAAITPIAHAADTARTIPDAAYPRILAHHFLVPATEESIAALAKRDVLVLAAWYRKDLETVRKIRALNPRIVILMYGTLDSAFYTDEQKFGLHVWGIGNLDEAREFASHPEAWLYENPTGSLAVALSAEAKEATVSGLDVARLLKECDPAERLSGRAVVAVEDELIRLESIQGERCTLRRGQCGTKAVAHPHGSAVRVISQCSWASSVQRGGQADAELLRLNLSDRAPLIAGRRPWQMKADFYLKTYWQNPAWRACFDGFFFDNGHDWQTLQNVALDVDNDGRTDADAYAAIERGVRAFFDHLRSKGGPALLVTPNNLSDLVPSASGRHREFFVGQVSIATFPVGDAERWPFSLWEYSMEPYRAYQAAGSAPQLTLNTTQPGIWDDYRQMRFALGSALLLDGASQYRAFSGDRGNWQHWYDEYSVDTQGKATDGSTGRHWLGKPLGEAKQLTQPLDTPNLLQGARWKLRTHEAADAEFSETGDTLRVNITTLPDHQASNVQLFTRVRHALAAGDTMTLTVEMKASKPRLILFALAGGAKDLPVFRTKIVAPLFISTTWEKRTFSFTMRDERPLPEHPFTFMVGDELGTVELRNITWQAGAAVKGWQREFEHGLVLVNPTLQPQTFPIIGKFQRLLGRQDPAHNNGQPVDESLTIAAADAVLLFRSAKPSARAGR